MSNSAAFAVAETRRTHTAATAHTLALRSNPDPPCGYRSRFPQVEQSMLRLRRGNRNVMVARGPRAESTMN